MPHRRQPRPQDSLASPHLDEKEMDDESTSAESQSTVSFDVKSILAVLEANCTIEEQLRFWMMAEHKIRSSTAKEFGRVLPEDTWGDLLAALPDVEPDAATRNYCVIEAQKADETRVALFMVARDGDDETVSLVDAYDAYYDTHGFDRVYVTRKMEPLAVPAVIAPHRDDVLAPHRDDVLGSLLKDFVQYPLPVAAYCDPVMRDDWLSRAMVVLSDATDDSVGDTVARVHKQIRAWYADDRRCNDDGNSGRDTGAIKRDDGDVDNKNDGAEAWLGMVTRVSLFNERRLQLLLRLSADRQAAIEASPLFVLCGDASLVDRAAAAYRGRLERGCMPDDIIRRAAAYAWHGICTEARLASGHLPRADDLVDVARALGVEPDPLQQKYPELLCGVLAEPAIVEIARSRYSIEPISRSAGKRPRAYRWWLASAWRRTGSTLHEPLDGKSNALIGCLEFAGVEIDPQDKADARRLFVRLAACMIAPSYLEP
ncbi:hypothetical protein psal_cds_1064 [Pandoravirus salinus]|uniref:Uncharacterized protein n=1 Tax=Pandoravirus salinus TaxID=1349410 RepID=S4W0F6_9VIRU|nr:hypothetical protein psal_cds_1064 [Pandoravirus salinus]AGO85271.1 hypothetical protein psal_cds_1064 [Pandoravirus salinus]